jgi:hypothetical protein
MAAAAMPQFGGEIKLDINPQVFALRWIEGKSVQSRFPGGRVMFSASDGRKLFLNDEEASELEHGLRELDIRANELFRAQRISHTRGGGFSIRVERTAPPVAAPAASAYSLQGHALAPAPIEPNNRPNNSRDQANTPAPPAPPTSAPAESPNPMAQAFVEAIDAIRYAQQYAQRAGAGLTFSEESVRAAAISIYIQTSKGGR